MLFTGTPPAAQQKHFDKSSLTAIKRNTKTNANAQTKAIKRKTKTKEKAETKAIQRKTKKTKTVFIYGHTGGTQSAAKTF